ncbi:MAG TPA: SAM-dependent chlorinase/fluorinase [Bryobacteraceae bacterium]|nr:SAM-dependent chlorinase/fluorinase [Bryobacteraceae bacterium]
MSRSPRIITLTTDFGLSDHFVGAMKGVIASIAPAARVIDISHEIAPFEILEGAFVIGQAWANFPKGTIHVIVVDPGVGSARRPILAEAGGHCFIAPDNGVLSMVYDAAKPARPKIRVISNPKLLARAVSRTFHGRDVFAPAAAHLARGVAPARFGKIIDDEIHLPDIKPSRSAAGWRGMVLKVDRFGNLITNFHRDEFANIASQPFELSTPSAVIRRFAETFSEVPEGELAAIFGSSGFLEIAANQHSAAKLLGCGVRSPLNLRFL